MAGQAAVSRTFRHLALLYRGRAGYTLAVRGFIRDSLDRDEPLLVVVPDRNADLLRADLGAEASRVTWMDMTALGRNPARIIPAVSRFHGPAPGPAGPLRG